MELISIKHMNSLTKRVSMLDFYKGASPQMRVKDVNARDSYSSAHTLANGYSPIAISYNKKGNQCVWDNSDYSLVWWGDNNNPHVKLVHNHKTNT